MTSKSHMPKRFAHVTLMSKISIFKGSPQLTKFLPASQIQMISWPEDESTFYNVVPVIQPRQVCYSGPAIALETSARSMYNKQHQEGVLRGVDDPYKPSPETHCEMV